LAAICATAAGLDAIVHVSDPLGLDVLGGGVRSTELKAVARAHAEAGLIALQAFVDAGLHLWSGLVHGIPPGPLAVAVSFWLQGKTRTASQQAYWLGHMQQSAAPSLRAAAVRQNDTGQVLRLLAAGDSQVMRVLLRPTANSACGKWVLDPIATKGSMKRCALAKLLALSQSTTGKSE